MQTSSTTQHDKPSSDIIHVDIVAEYLQENETSQEFKDLISKLPTETGWVANHLHEYQGFWHTTRQLRGVVACQMNFKAQENDIFLITTPKSGSTWLKALVFALLNRVNFNVFSQNHPLLSNNPHGLVPFLEHEYISKEVMEFDNYGFDYDLKSSTTPPRLFSSHLPLASLPQTLKDTSSCKIVYLCRNPKDTFVSLWHFTNRLRPQEKGHNSLEETFDKFCRGVSLYGPFWDHVLGYWKESIERPTRVLFIKFEDLKREPHIQLNRLSHFLGCPFSLEEESNGVVDEIVKLCSFDNLKNLEVNKSGKLKSGEPHQTFFRSGQVGDSYHYLTSKMLEKMDVITQQKFYNYGLIF